MEKVAREPDQAPILIRYQPLQLLVGVDEFAPSRRRYLRIEPGAIEPQTALPQ